MRLFCSNRPLVLTVDEPVSKLIVSSDHKDDHQRRLQPFKPEVAVLKAVPTPRTSASQQENSASVGKLLRIKDKESFIP